jgi:hypothetical protein
VALTLAVVALVGIAGCIGGSGGSGTTTTTTTTTATTSSHATTTQKTTTTGTPTLSSISLPEGITESKVAESTLLKAHSGSLSGLTFTNNVQVDLISAVNTDNPSALSQSFTARADLPNNQALVVSGVDGKTRRAKYMDGGQVFSKTIAKNGETSYSVIDRKLRESELTGDYLYDKYLKALNLKPVETVSESGQTLIKLKVDGYSDKDLIASRLKASSVKAPTGTALVTRSGRIHSLSFSIPFSTKSSDTLNKLSVSATLKTQDVSVSKPSWTDKATEQSVTVDVSIVDKTAVAMTPQNAKIPKGTTLFVSTEATGESRLKVQSTVKSGETLYLYVENGAVKLSTSKPSSGETIESYSMVAVAPDGSELFRANG